MGLPEREGRGAGGSPDDAAAAAARLSMVELRRGYVSGRWTPTQVVDALAERIAALDPRLNALTALCLERARAEAAAATLAFRSGSARPLEGVPFVAKDLFDTDGVETTYGSAIYRGHVPEADAAAVALLRAAGAILLGKAATHEFAWGLTTVNPHYGATRNPWDPARVSGGSSGGSAVAVAAQMAPFALGTDTAGSIRVPAAFCGVVGLKPTYGLVPADGVFPLAPTLDHVGVLARTPDDVALTLTTLTGRVHVATGRDELRGLRVGCVDPGDPDVATVLSALGEAGAVSHRIGLPPAADLVATTAVVQRAEAAQVHRARGLFPAQAQRYGADVAARLELAEAVGLDEHLAACAARERLRADVARTLRSVDVLVLPLAPVTPPEISAVQAGGEESLRASVLETTVLANLLGLPACAVRTRFDEHGMPRAAQLVGRPFGEPLLLGAARVVSEALSEVWRREPALA